MCLYDITGVTLTSDVEYSIQLNKKSDVKKWKSPLTKPLVIWHHFLYFEYGKKHRKIQINAVLAIFYIISKVMAFPHSLRLLSAKNRFKNVNNRLCGRRNIDFYKKNCWNGRRSVQSTFLTTRRLAGGYAKKMP